MHLPHAIPLGPAGHRVHCCLPAVLSHTHLLSLSAPGVASAGPPGWASTSSWLPSLAAPQWILQPCFQNSSQFLFSRTLCVISARRHLLSDQAATLLEGVRDGVPLCSSRFLELALEARLTLNSDIGPPLPPEHWD